MKQLWLVALAAVSTGAYAQAYGQIPLRQSDAVEVLIGPIVDSADATVETGLTISQADVLLIKCAPAGDCGGSAQKNETTACSHVAGGVYECDLDTTDTNTVGVLRVNVQESGTAPWFKDYVVVEEAVFDASMAASATPLTAAAVVDNFETQSQADPTGFHVNVLEIGGTAQTANDNGADINSILADTGTDGVVVAAGSKTGYALSTAGVNALRDVVIEDQGGGVSLACALAVLLAYAAGDLATSGADSTYEDPSGTETRVTGTVASDGNRTAAITCPSF